jgi:O-antigen ligase
LVLRPFEPARVPENYFLQIGQETGWPGLTLFIMLLAAVAGALWRRRSSPLSLMLLASFVGLNLVALVSHSWTDDTLAYLWWGLAGLAVGMTTKNRD